MSRPDTKASRNRGAILARQEGIALLMAIFITATLAALAVSFSTSTQRHLQLTRYYKNNVQAYWTAQSGIQAAAAVLRLSRQLNLVAADGYTSPWHHESFYYKETVQAFSALPLCSSSFPYPTLLPALEDPLAVSTGDTEVQTTRSPCFFIDENSKLSLYSLVDHVNQPGEKVTETIYSRLVQLIMRLIRDTDLVAADTALETLAGTAGQPIKEDKATALANYLVDWIDTPNNGGTINPDVAEDACPEDGLPYAAKDGRLDSAEEIALVCGFRQIPRHVIEELCRNLTTYSLETNVNTATRPVLCAIALQSGGDEQECSDLYSHLHPEEANEEYDLGNHLIQNEGNYASDLEKMGLSLSDGFRQALQADTGVKSDYIRAAVSGVVLDPESGTLEAESRITVVLSPQMPGELAYYRED